MNNWHFLSPDMSELRGGKEFLKCQESLKGMLEFNAVGSGFQESLIWG